MKQGLLILTTVICWGVWGIVNKIAVQKISPLYMQIVSCAVAILTIPLCFVLIKSSSKPIDFNWAGVYWTILGSTLATAAYFSYLYSLRNGEVGTVSVLSACYPALTFMISAIFLGESITSTKLIGVALTMLGVVVLSQAN